MKFAIRLPANFLYPSLTSSWETKLGPDESLRFARRADELGFDWLWVAEHIIQMPALLPAMGSRFYEGVSAAGVLLGATRRIGVLTYIAVLPYHNPLVYAKAIATVDHLSGGRVALGLACGWLQGEFEALGVPFDERGRRTDESLRVMKELWTSERPCFDGEFYRFEDVIFEPKPLQEPHPPIFVGGDARPAQRRAAELGDGWLPWLTTPEEVPGCLSYIREQPGFQERSGPFEVLMLLLDIPPDDRLDMGRYRIPRQRDEVVALLDRIAAAGATGTMVHLPETSGLEECLEWLEWFSQEIMPDFKNRTNPGDER
jgi:probable F420-dependent oxidoreductase